MAGNIKGITIEFQGDTTKLDKALRQIEKNTKSLDNELKQVDKALKFNPTSVELWRQKQDLLTKKISETKSRLDLLKDTQKRIDSGEITATAEEYQKLRRDIIITENQVKTFESQLRKIGNVNLKALSEQIKNVGSKLESAGQAMRGLSMAAAAVEAAIGALVVKSASWADDLNTMSKVYGISTDQLQMYSAAAGLVDVELETIAGSHRKLTKSMASAQGGTGAAAEAFQTLGVNVTNADGSLRDGEAVWQEVIAALGRMENETERDAIAMQLMGKSASELNPLIEDGGEAYKNLAATMAQYDLAFVDEETLARANEFNDSLDTIKALGMTAFQQLGTTLAAYLAPALEKVVDWVGKLANWLSNLSPEVLTIITVVGGVVAGLGPVLIVLGKLATGISAIINLVGVIGPALGALSGPVGIVIAVIAALVAAGIALYKNWDTIKAKVLEFKDRIVTAFQAVKERITTIFNNIKTAIMKPFQTAIEFIRNGIAKIKNIINNAKLQLPKFKLPHFKISAGKLPWGIGGQGVKPSISVDWYAKGGIFDVPSIIGVGEKGPEAVVPLDTLWSKLDAIAAASGASGGPIVININGANRDPREIAEEVKRMLVRETNQRRLAWQ